MPWDFLVKSAPANFINEFNICFCFLAIGNSFAVLSNPEKRKKYDLYGPDSPALNHNHSHNHHHEFEGML